MSTRLLPVCLFLMFGCSHHHPANVSSAVLVKTDKTQPMGERLAPNAAEQLESNTAQQAPVDANLLSTCSDSPVSEAQLGPRRYYGLVETEPDLLSEDFSLGERSGVFTQVDSMFGTERRTSIPMRRGLPHGTVVVSENGRKVDEISFQMGQRHGARIRWTREGARLAEEFYEQGKPHGHFRYWNEAGDFLGGFEIVKGTGVMLSWYPNGAKKSQVPYQSGLVHGKEVHYYLDGQTQLEGRLASGKRVGLWQGWHRKGQQALRCNYVDGKKQGVCLESGRWLEQLQSIEIDAPFYDETVDEAYGRYQNGRRVGRWIERHRNRKVGEGLYRDSKRSGAWAHWSDGFKIAEGSYDKGNPTGPWKLWSHGFSSSRQSSGQFRNGKREGLWTYRNEEGEKIASTVFKAGERENEVLWLADKKVSDCQYRGEVNHGTCVEWHRNGQQSSECNYVEGEPDGVCIQWHENGARSSTSGYKDQLRSGSWESWDEEGTRLYEQSYLRDDLHGVERRWREGRLSQENHYRHGELHGMATSWHDNGVMAQQGEYRQGVEDGVWRRWNELGALEEKLHWSSGVRSAE